MANQNPKLYNISIHSYYTIPQILQLNDQYMSTIRPDQFPNYQSSGFKKQVPQSESTATCLQPQNPPFQIPQDKYKYSKSYKQQPGVTIKHFGHYNDPLPEQNFTYGVPTQKSQGSENVLKAGQLQGAGKFLNDLNQSSKYKSLKTQPLGQTINRNYNLPQEALNQQFKYGLPTEKNVYGAKQTIYSGINMLQNQDVRKLYLTSHGEFDAGEQKNRSYQWKIDPTDFRFGKIEKNVIPNQMHQIMAPEGQNQQFPETKFVSTHVNDFNARKDDKLGKPANLGQKQFPSDHVFGVRVEPNVWDAGKCLRGEATEYEVRPDDDLGKSNRHGFRNVVKEGDEQRVFGVPTIRYDVKKPARVSVADPNNYADETMAIELLFPQNFAIYGVNDKDFKKPRTKKEIQEIFTNIGFAFKDNIFDAIFQRSKAIEGTILDKVSCDSFKKALYDMAS